MYDCPYCGSKNIILDECRGECICKMCGTVVEEKIPVFDLFEHFDQME